MQRVAYKFWWWVLHRFVTAHSLATAHSLSPTEEEPTNKASLKADDYAGRYAKDSLMAGSSVLACSNSCFGGRHISRHVIMSSCILSIFMRLDILRHCIGHILQRIKHSFHEFSLVDVLITP